MKHARHVEGIHVEAMPNAVERGCRVAITPVAAGPHGQGAFRGSQPCLSALPKQANNDERDMPTG
jgi:hypothetical protein